MKQFSIGLFAALIATLALSVLMVAKAMMSIMPALDLPKMISGMMGVPGAPIVGWAVHFMIGVVLYGAAIATIGERLPGNNHVVHGLILGVAGWFVMMVMLMPMVGTGFFGMSLGMMAPIMTLMLHLIFGAVLGWVYGRAIGSTDVGVSAQIAHVK